MSLRQILIQMSSCLVVTVLCCPCLGQCLRTSDQVEPIIILEQSANAFGEYEPQALSEEDATADAPKADWTGASQKFYLGAFASLLGHEAGHLIANVAVGSKPHTKSVKYGPIPFFTIEPGRKLNPREHYITASAGFNSQHIINEWLLTKHPNLREEDEPFLKGMATFNFWLTVGYALTAFAHTGPPERDTKGMADSLGWSESRVGAMILVPTLLDAYRYKHPDAKWAKTASRLSKLYIVGLALTVDD